MKLSRALLCLDCEEIVSADSPTCPACDGGVLFPLVKWLEPKEGNYILR